MSDNKEIDEKNGPTFRPISLLGLTVFDAG